MDDTVLAQIKRQELELQARLLQTKQAAEATLAEARAGAAELRRSGERAAEAAARELRQAELRRTDAELAEIEALTRRRLAGLSQQTSARSELVRRVLLAVAPGAEESGVGPD